jgi:hypothetical protein
MVLANTITSLLNTNQDLAKEWHPTKNAPLSPKDVTQGSGKEVWWVCGIGHEWKAAIYNRNKGVGCPYCNKGVGCPYCSGRLATKGKNLQVINPSLAKEWHPTKNAPLTPRDVTQGSGKEVWWVCGKGHEWEARIYDRNRSKGCPYCAGRKVCNDNCLQTVNSPLAKEWHPTRNAPLTPRDVTPNSNKKVWWSCSKRHEWRTTVAHRNRGNGCPYCAGKTVCNDNCLQTVNPSLAEEWHPTKNETLTPRDVTPKTKV